jgi:hypothetical protein
MNVLRGNLVSNYAFVLATSLAVACGGLASASAPQPQQRASDDTPAAPNPVAPRSLADHLSASGITMGPAVPFKSVLARKELEQWITHLSCDPVQASAVRAAYDRWLLERHNPMVDASLPRFLDLCDRFAKAVDAHGDSSPRAAAAFDAASREAGRILVESHASESALVDEVSGLIAADERDRLSRWHVSAAQRMVEAIGTNDRWIRCDPWLALDEQLGSLGPEQRACVVACLRRHDAACAPLLVEWSRAMLESGRQSQRMFAAEAAGEPSQDARVIWSKPARLQASVRQLHVQAMDDAVACLDAAGAIVAREAVSAYLFPECAVGPELAAVRDAMLRANAWAGSDPTRVSAVEAERVRFDTAYASATKALEARCVQWDEARATGVSGLTAAGLPVALKPDLEARRSLCDETRTRLERLVSP